MDSQEKEKKMILLAAISFCLIGLLFFKEEMQNETGGKINNIKKCWKQFNSPS